MNQQEINELIDMFHKCHTDCAIVHKKDFMAIHRHDCAFQKKGMSVVRDEGYEPVMICYFNKIVHPSQF